MKKKQKSGLAVFRTVGCCGSVHDSQLLECSGEVWAARQALLLSHTLSSRLCAPYHNKFGKGNGHGRTTRDCSVHGALTSTVGERGSAVGASNFKQIMRTIWSRRGAVRPGTPLQVEEVPSFASQTKLCQKFLGARCQHCQSNRRTHSWGKSKKKAQNKEKT